MGTTIVDGIKRAFEIEKRYFMPFCCNQLALTMAKLIELGNFNKLAHVLAKANPIVALSLRIVNSLRQLVTFVTIKFDICEMLIKIQPGQ